MLVNLAPTIGIDIGSSAIKCSEIAPNGLRLKALGLEILPEGVVDAHEIVDEDLLRDHLLTLFEKLKINPKTRQVCFALDGPNTDVRVIQVPHKIEDIGEFIKYEAEQLLNFSIEDAVISYDLLAKGQTEDTYIFVGAVRDYVDQWMEFFEGTQCKIGIVEPITVSLINALHYNYDVSNLNVILLHIGAAYSKIIQVNRGILQHSRFFDFGSRQYTNQLMTVKSLSYEDAEIEKMKISYGLLKADEVSAQIFTDLNQAFKEAFFSVLSELNPEGEGGKYQALFLSGGGAKIYRLREELTVIPKVLELNPFQNLRINKEIFSDEYLFTFATHYPVSVSLGTRKVHTEMKQVVA